ncbi:hypothetical protein PSGK_07550 [Pseudomonas solani]|uniref:hypothetical protein n=1 Tax=Pseudomonas solani TaxID=2731552 RepID=UPI0035BE17A2
MAIWQFGMYLVPRAGVLSVHGCIPYEIDEYKPHDASADFDEGKVYPDYWEGKGVPDSIRRKVSEKFPRIHSWSDEAEMYGDEDGTKVEIWLDDVMCFVDSRCDAGEVLRFFVDLAEEGLCLIVLKEDGRVLDALLDSVVNEFYKSRAFRFSLDPTKTILES